MWWRRWTDEWFQCSVGDGTLWPLVQSYPLLVAHELRMILQSKEGWAWGLPALLFVAFQAIVEPLAGSLDKGLVFKLQNTHGTIRTQEGWLYLSREVRDVTLRRGDANRNKHLIPLAVAMPSNTPVFISSIFVFFLFKI